MYISIENGNYSEITLKISKLFRRFMSFMKRFIGIFTHKNTPDNHEWDMNHNAHNNRFKGPSKAPKN